MRWARREPAERSGGGARLRGVTRKRQHCTGERQPVKRSVGVTQRRARADRTKCLQHLRQTDPRRGPRLGAQLSHARQPRGPQAVFQAGAAAQTRGAVLPAQEPPGRGSLQA